VKRKRFTAEHIAEILKQAELGSTIGELRRQHGISEQSYYRWKKMYGNPAPSEVRELRRLRVENVDRTLTEATGCQPAQPVVVRPL
jgi:putative transposase